MTDASLSARFSESDFRVGRVLNRTASVLSRNFLIFFVITAVAHLPTLLLFNASTTITATSSGGEILRSSILIVLGLVLTIVLSTLSQAIVLYGAFQDMRGRQVNLTESLQVGLRRFFPIVGLAISMTLLGALAAILLLIPALILFTMWFVATPACVVERLGPSSSMRRSSQLTKGHRWKIFGLMLLLIIASAVAGPTITVSLTAIGGTPLALIGDVLWNGVWGAFYAISVVVTYHDLRVAKEGIDIDQIAAVFD
jgi:MFS family permease